MKLRLSPALGVVIVLMIVLVCQAWGIQITEATIS